MRMTDSEFLQAVETLAPRTAVFDYDGTLWPGDAGSGFMQWSMRTGLLSAEKIDHLTHRHDAYHRGEVGETAICGEMVQIYSGLREEDVRSSARDYFQAEVEPHLFPTMVGLVRQLKAAGVEIWAVSSTNNWVIEEGVVALGIAPDRVLGACVAAADGLVTDTLIDVPSGTGKAEALRRAGLPQPDCVFGNSVHDAAMLELARMPFAVNPNADLQEMALARGWAIYFPEAPRSWTAVSPKS